MPRWLRSWGECSDVPVAPAEGARRWRISSQVAVFFLVAYRNLISPFLPSMCRFYPSCSAYAIEAIGRHGIARGTVLTMRRLLRCQPLNQGGYDPVPRGRGLREMLKSPRA